MQDQYEDAQEEHEPTWVEGRTEIHKAIEELDRACAHARQVIYRLRPLVKPTNGKTANRTESEVSPRPARFRRRREPA